MKNVLIVSPNFPPINAADHQRIRMALPYLEAQGWAPHILAVEPKYIEGVWDPLLERTIPPSVPVTRTSAMSAGWTRRFGVGSLALRSLPYLRAEGRRRLKEKKFDLVFFSTTMFPVMALGPRWFREFKVPYVLDFQDPWWNPYYDSPRAPAPPGGPFKFALTQRLSKFFESRAIQAASRLVCVSPAYRDMFLTRYPLLRKDQILVLPFGAAEKDFETLAQLQVRQTVYDPGDSLKHWVYVGRGGRDMAFAAKAFFQALAKARAVDPETWRTLRLHFIGTSYAPPGHAAPKTFEPLAAACGVGDLVIEQTNRLPYFESLQCLKDADALIVFGSDDPGYTASKIYPYILSKKPILAIFQEKSSVVDVVRSCRAGTVVTFGASEESLSLTRKIMEGWFSDVSVRTQTPSTDWSAFSRYTAREQTRTLCGWFDAACVTISQHDA
jgi:hypothetical protein